MSPPPIYLDATMLYRWRHLAPVGIVRLERMLCSHLHFRSGLGQTQLVLWDAGYRPADAGETELLERLLNSGAVESTGPAIQASGLPVNPSVERHGSGVRWRLRRLALKTLARLPDHLRPFAEQAVWGLATFGVEAGRHVRRRRHARAMVGAHASRHAIAHGIDLERGGDIVALGLGWEYLDHQAMYELKRDHGFRIHMPAFDLIPVQMPQMNAAQRDLVHQYYAEMAHYADTITSISYATTESLRRFYADEMLPVPELRTNQVPAAELSTGAVSDGRRHRLHGSDFVLSVSTVEIRKNHLLLAKIWRECALEGDPLPKLAIVGRIGWDVDELMRWIDHAPELRDSVMVFTDVDDDELAQLYRDCLFTVFPSRIEGWGMPITESMAYGKVCVHSIDPAQIEASQGLMPAHHPDDMVSWKREIAGLAGDPRRRSELEAVIADRYQVRSIEDYCRAFEQIIAERRS